MKHIFTFFLIFFFIVNSFAQIGGEHTFAILNFNPSVRTAAMGGEHVSLFDDDVDIAVINPGFLNSKMSNQVSFSFIDYFTDINAAVFKKYIHIRHRAPRHREVTIMSFTA